jgi:hypothetical protein
MEETENALILLPEAEIAFGEIDNIKDKVSVLVELAILQVEAGQREKAMDAAVQVWRLSESVRDRNSIPLVTGRAAVLFARLRAEDRAVEAVSRIIQTVQEMRAKTSGLGPVVEDLLEAGENGLALRLAEVIREPDVKALALVSVAESMMEQISRLIVIFEKTADLLFCFFNTAIYSENHSLSQASRGFQK